MAFIARGLPPALGSSNSVMSIKQHKNMNMRNNVAIHELNLSQFRVKCSSGGSGSGSGSGSGVGDHESEYDCTITAYSILGVQPGCSAPQLKAAFRAKVKEFHPDVNSLNTAQHHSDYMIRRVIQAYQILTNITTSQIIESECLDPFDNPECEAHDIFVNQRFCLGKGCPYSCVNKAPHAFTYSTLGTACATSQGHAEDYPVQLAVGQCPTSCIHYVTPSQRIILEELLDSILDTPYDTSAEADLLYSLIVKAKYENNRYQKPKKQPKASAKHVDWF